VLFRGMAKPAPQSGQREQPPHKLSDAEYRSTIKSYAVPCGTPSWRGRSSLLPSASRLGFGTVCFGPGCCYSRGPERELKIRMPSRHMARSQTNGRRHANVIQPGDSLRPPAVPRTTPIAGSEEALRRHIEAIRSGAPDYDRDDARSSGQYSPAIAARTGDPGQTRRSARNVVSRRGPSRKRRLHDPDRNGSAELQIGLVDDGRIGRIVLGPQY
jgi:hypothetical protein